MPPAVRRALPTGHVMTFLQASAEHRKCWVSAKSAQAGAPMTHTFMDRTGTGRLFVPPALDDAFYAAVARDAAAGTLPPLNELRANPAGIFRFFVDLDMHLTPEEAADDAATAPAAVGACCAREVQRFLSGNAARNVRCLVLTSPDRSPAADAGGKVKRGVHLHFPLVRVGTHEALLMREALVVALKRDVSARVDWADDVDNAPYVNPSGGLRMLGASKAITCTACRDVVAQRKDCLLCFGSGREVEEAQRYTLHTVLDGQGEVDEETLGFLRLNAAACTRAASVRTSRTTVMPEWECFDGCPNYSELRVRANAPPKPGNKRRAFAEESRSVSKWPKVEVVDGEKRRCLQALFRRRFAHVGGGVYSNVNVSSVRYSARNNTYYAQFSDEGESYCMNIGGRHKSNRVYGVVDHHSAYVRCHCSCATTVGRISGKMCREFRSPPVTLTRQDIGVLFGDVDAGGGMGKTPAAKAAPATGDEYLANLSRTLYAANNMG